MKILIALVLSALLVGCASSRSGYQEFYRPTQWLELSDVELLPEGGSPKIHPSDNLNRDVKIMRSKGFVVIGYSSFNGAIESNDKILRQAHRVGATLVLVNLKYTETRTTTVPLVLPNNSTTYSSGSVYGGYGTYGTYSGLSTTYGNTVVPMTTQQQRYDQTAVFFAKSKQKLKFGVEMEELTPEQQAALERNTGACIAVVREDSPAFFANVLPEDVLIEIDGVIVINAQHASQVMKASNPQNGISQWKVIRNGVEKLIAIQFASE